MGANRFLAVPSPHGRMVLRAWLAAERDAARARSTVRGGATTAADLSAGREPKLGAHRLPPPHFTPLLGAARKFASTPKVRARLGVSER